MRSQSGDVWRADLGLAAESRPVMSRHEVPLPKLLFLDRDSFANVQGVASLSVVRLERLPVAVMTEFIRSLAFALDFD